MIVDEWRTEGFAVSRLLKILELPRSTYYRSKSASVEKETLKRGRPVPGFSKTFDGTIVPDAFIEDLLMEFAEHDWYGALGYRKWVALLRDRHNIQINHKKGFRICDELNILKPKYERKSKHPRKLAIKHQISQSNQLWQMDIKYGKIAHSPRFVFVCSVIDVFDRSIVGSYMGPSCRAKDVTLMMTKALIRRKIHFKPPNDNLIIRTDNGPQFVSEHFGDYCVNRDLYHERIPPRTPDMNAYIESYFSRLQAECFDRHPFHLYDEAYHYINEFTDFYNYDRPHGSLKNLSPDVFYERWRAGHITQEPLSI
ncbi:IS3 family transposase [Halalkalibacillus halophilus]|uniref:IS3 family transposase n=1 Tax=Halalkalibacillus halophilus TaxID=392827 RepID=UPI0003FEFFAE|nr:IS3 family transposase [Halalkalibacillus halophilus]